MSPSPPGGPPVPDDEAHRLRRTTRHLALSVAAVLVFAAAFAGIYWWTRTSEQPPGPDPVPTASPTPVPPAPDRETLLIQVTTTLGAVGNMLSGVPADGETATIVPLRSDLVVTAPQGAPQPLARTVSSLDTLLPSDAVAATLGVRVDASWRMDRKALAGLVDSVGGFVVRSPERVRVRDETGAVVVRVRPGRQRLSGTDASWYAVGTISGQDVAAETERFRRVLTTTLARLPDSDVAIRESLTALGALAPSSIGTQELADYLLDLSLALRGGDVTEVALPATELRLGGTSAAWLDYTGATPALRRTLAYAPWSSTPDAPARVLVLGARQTPTQANAVREALVDAGLVFVDGRGTPVGDDTARVLARDPVVAREVATVLDLPRRSIRLAPPAPVLGPPWADVDSVLPPDYLPPEPS